MIPFCKERNITVIEDASESLGTYYSTGKYRNCHTGTIGRLGCISFNGNKIITTGGGGMILTNKKELSEKELNKTKIVQKNNQIKIQQKK